MPRWERHCEFKCWEKKCVRYNDRGTRQVWLHILWSLAPTEMPLVQEARGKVQIKVVKYKAFLLKKKVMD